MAEKIKDIITRKISGEWGKEANSDESVFVIRTANFRNDGTIKYDNLVRRDIDKKKVESKKLIQGDVIIEKSGGSPSQPVGRVVYFDSEASDTFLCNNFTSILRPDKSKVFPRYFFYALLDNYQIGKVRKYQNKTTGIINLKLDRYLNEELELPNYNEQIVIANYLDKAQSLIQKRRETLHLLDKLLRDTFLDMFGDPVVNPKSFQVVTLSELGNWKSGGTPSRTKPEYFEGKIPWYSSGELNEIFISKSNEKITEDAIKKTSAKSVPTGSLLIGMYDTAALKSSITKVKASCNQAIAFAKLNEEKCISLFVYFAVQLSKDYYLKMRRGVRQKNLNLSIIKSIEIPLPKMELQNHFSEKVNSILKLQDKTQRSLSELKTLFQSLLQKAFRGELESDESQVFEEIIAEMEVKDFRGNSKRLALLSSFLNENKFESLTNYDKAKKILFQLMEEREKGIEQTYQNQSIKLSNETN